MLRPVENHVLQSKCVCRLQGRRRKSYSYRKLSNHSSVSLTQSIYYPTSLVSTANLAIEKMVTDAAFWYCRKKLGASNDPAVAHSMICCLPQWQTARRDDFHIVHGEESFMFRRMATSAKSEHIRGVDVGSIALSSVRSSTLKTGKSLTLLRSSYRVSEVRPLMFFRLLTLVANKQNISTRTSNSVIRVADIRFPTVPATVGTKKVPNV